MFKRLTVGTAAAALAAGCTSTGTTSTGAAGATSAGTASTASPPASVLGCDQKPVTRPKSYILTCGDGGVFLDRLSWSDWGAARAVATGVQTRSSCVPSCAAGSPVSVPVTVALSGLSAGHYTRLHVLTAQGPADYTIDAHGPLAATGGR